MFGPALAPAPISSYCKSFNPVSTLSQVRFLKSGLIFCLKYPFWTAICLFFSLFFFLFEVRWLFVLFAGGRTGPMSAGGVSLISPSSISPSSVASASVFGVFLSPDSLASTICRCSRRRVSISECRKIAI